MWLGSDQLPFRAWLISAESVVGVRSDEAPKMINLAVEVDVSRILRLTACPKRESFSVWENVRRSGSVVFQA